MEAISLLPQAPAELANAIQAIESPSMLADMIASFLDIKVDRQAGAPGDDRAASDRLERVSNLLTRRVEVLKLSRQIEEQTKEALDDRQKEILLREQMRQIRKELGEDGQGRRGDRGAVRGDHEGRHAAGHRGAGAQGVEAPRAHERGERRVLDGAHLPRHAARLPWSKLDAEDIDIERARGILDEDHYGLEKVKKRIVEYLAVRKLNPQGRSPILCFVGPPGVGKTSLGQSIARALGIKFERVSLGGVHDEAEIRGHRRTYIGALPGNIIQAIRKAGTRNPVLMLDEIDKLGAGIQGDPASALLEVLDPEQNSTLPRQLPRRAVRPLEGALHRDRERARHDPRAAARPHGDHRAHRLHRGGEGRDRAALPGAPQLEANGLKPEQAAITDEALLKIARDYTREAGVRNLERRSARCCATSRCGSPKARPSRSRSTRTTWRRSSARRASRTRSRCG